MPDTKVNTATDATGGITDEIVSINGGHVVIWTSSETEGDILQRRYDANGAAVGDVTTVNTVTEGRQANFSATGLSTGGYVVVWTSPTASQGDLEIRARVYDATGAATGPQISLTEDANSRSVPQSITGLADGSFAMVWRTFTGSTSVDHVGRFTTQGVMLESVALPSVSGAINSVAGLAAGGYVLLRSDATPGVGAGAPISLTRFGADGVQQGSPVTVTADHPLGPNAPMVRAAGLEGGGFVVTWTSNNDGSSDVYIRQYDAAGVAMTQEILVNTATNLAQYAPSVTPLADGGYFVTWTGPDPATVNGVSTLLNHGYGQRYDASGARIGSEISISEDRGVNQYNTRGVALENGHVAFSWRSGSVPTATDVYQTVVDIVDGTPNPDTLTGTAGREFIYGYGGNDTIDGGGGADILDGGLGNDTINGGDGDDVIFGGAGGDNLNGGAGTDTLSYADAAVRANLFLSQTTALDGDDWDTYVGFENVTGSAFHDAIFGDAGNNVLKGLAGSDTLGGGAGDDTLDGGEGRDDAYYGAATGGVTVSLSVTGPQDVGGGQGIDTLISIGSLSGGNFNDVLTGNAEDNQLEGWVGDDILEGREGDDVIGGGEGSDTASYASASAAVSVSLMFSGLGQSTGAAGFDTLTSIENLTGSVFNDVLTGNELANVLTGGGGDDTIDGGDGHDTISPGLGDDTIIYSFGVDTISYAEIGGAVAGNGQGVTIDLRIEGAQDTIGAGTDTLGMIRNLVGSQYGDHLIGSTSIDIIDGSGGDDVIEGGKDNDTLRGGAGTDAVSYAGAEGAVSVDLRITTVQDTLAAGGDILSGFENITGSAFNDSLFGDAGDNVLKGLAGDDLLVGAAGDDTLDGGDGFDTARYRLGATSGVVIDLSAGGPQNIGGGFGADTFISIEGLIGTDFNDILTGNAGDNILSGLRGDNTLSGGGGNDALIGGVGSDTLDGGAGVDTASYVDAAGSVTVSLAVAGPQGAGAAGSDTLVSIENIIGSDWADILTGDGVNNVLTGGYGGDSLRGAGGNDTLLGQDGDDELRGGAGDDLLDGGAGLDTADYSDVGAGSGQGVSVRLAVSGPQDTGAGGVDTLVSVESLIGSEYADTLIGDSGANTLSGLGGDDFIEGGGGLDTLDGGSGVDTLSYADSGVGVTISLSTGGYQDTGGGRLVWLSGFENVIGSTSGDTLLGDANANVLTGGAGADYLSGAAGSDVLYGLDGNDIMVGGGGTSSAPDYFYGGAGNDIYYVASTLTSPLDLVFEGTLFAGSEAGVDDIDTIHSTGQHFWDYYSVGEMLYIDNAINGGAYLVGGKDVANKTIYGSSGADYISTYGRNARVDAGAGSDAISFNLYGLDESYRGSNTVVMKAGNGADYVHHFRSGTDHIDLTAFNFGITGQQVLDQAVNVDNAGTENDYSYFYLTSAGGVDNFIVFVGLLSSQLQASDFIT